MKKLFGLVILCTSVLSIAVDEPPLDQSLPEKSSPHLITTFLMGCATGGVQALLEDRREGLTMLSFPLVVGTLFHLYKKASEESLDYLLPYLWCYLLGHKLGNHVGYR